VLNGALAQQPPLRPARPGRAQTSGTRGEHGTEAKSSRSDPAVQVSARRARSRAAG
jgi:hypothetical protein